MAGQPHSSGVLIFTDFFYRYWSQEGVSASEAATDKTRLTCLSVHLTSFACLFLFTEVCRWNGKLNATNLTKQVNQTSVHTSLLHRRAKFRYPYKSDFILNFSPVFSVLQKY